MPVAMTGMGLLLWWPEWLSHQADSPFKGNSLPEVGVCTSFPPAMV